MRHDQVESNVTSAGAPFGVDDAGYERFKAKIRTLLRIDLDAYKSGQMRRRVTNFIGQRTGDLTSFLAALDRDAELVAALRDMLTINVSEFYRDVAQWERLQKEVMPALLKNNPKLNIWSAACSRGQEPYTVAIMLRELGADSGCRIVATDLDREVLKRAQEGGPYTADDVRGVHKPVLSKYFEEKESRYFVKPEIRRMVTFREQNLLSDPYQKGYDLILCRNVLIYFEVTRKTEVIQRFRDALNPDGVLFIGGTEALLGPDGKGYRGVGGNFYAKVPFPDERPARTVLPPRT